MTAIVLTVMAIVAYGKQYRWCGVDTMLRWHRLVVFMGLKWAGGIGVFELMMSRHSHSFRFSNIRN